MSEAHAYLSLSRECAPDAGLAENAEKVVCAVRMGCGDDGRELGKVSEVAGMRVGRRNDNPGCADNECDW